ncbi:MAG TPA: hypothetical protein VHD83_04345 [Puia sp.]|nr:hypothetical protein [Puia sp.]
MITPGQKYAVLVLFGIPWIVFGIQHYMYADFVSTLVPAYMPWRLFWAYFTGTAMLAAGVSFVIRKQVQLAAFLLGCLMLLYLFMVHPLMLSGEPQVGQHWTRFMQDIAIMAATFALAIVSGSRREVAKNWGTDAAGLRGWRAWLASPRASMIVRYCYALPFIVLGAQHFTHNVFVTAKVPDWAPFVQFWDYVIGAALIAAVYGILFAPPRTEGSTRRWTAGALGIMLTALALLRHVPLLVTSPHNGGEWTNAFLDLALAAGAFILSVLLGKVSPAKII